MVRPAIWSDTNRFLWATGKKGDSTDIGCGNFDLPDDTEFEIHNGNKPDCQQWWATVGTEVPGEANSLIDQIRPDVDCSEENTQELHQKFPWSAPGTAPVVSPCGAKGGYPYGCSGAKKMEMSVLATEKIGHLKSLDLDHLPLVVWLISINGQTHLSLNGKLAP